MAEPQKRDDKERGAHIPLAVLQKREKKLFESQQKKVRKFFSFNMSFGKVLFQCLFLPPSGRL